MNIGKWISDHTGAKSVVLGLVGILIALFSFVDVSDDTGDIVQGEVIIGYTVERHRAVLEAREAELSRQLTEVSANERRFLNGQLAETRRQLSSVEASFHAREQELLRLRSKLSDLGEGFAQEQIDAAKQALFEGDTSKAQALFEDVTRMGQETVDRMADAEFQLGKIAEDEIRWYDALEHYKRAADLNPNTERLNMAAQFNWRTGNYAEAERLARIGLKKADAENHLEDKALWLNSAALYSQYQGRYDEAEPLYRQAIKIAKTTIGEEHPDYAISLNNLAGLLRAMGRLDEAEPLYRQAIKIDKTTIGEGHPSYAKRLNNLALLLRDMGRYEEAEPLFRQAMGITKTALGEGHPSYAIRLNNLALLLADMGRLDESRSYFAEMLPIFRNSLGDEHHLTITDAGNYARLLREHFPDDPALAELEATFGPDIGK